VTRLATGLVVAAVVVAACSGLDEGEAGVVGIEVRVPGPDSVEVGESIQLGVRPLDKNGDSVGAAVTWASLDPAATIDPVSGVLTGVSVGTARVQAAVGALGSALVTFAVVARPDTLLIVGDSILTISRDSATLPGFPTQVRNFTTDDPVAGHPVVYTLVSPDPATAPPSLVFTGLEALADTIATGADGIATASLRVLGGTTAPDSAIVVISAKRVRGAAVPGSGQRFILRFQ
jgi:hypothetical protein